MFCNKCGKENLDTDKFCTGCGATLMRSETTASTDTAASDASGADARDADVVIGSVTSGRRPTEQQNNGKGMSVAGMVLGIISCVLAWIYGINIIALITGIVGIILASKGKKNAVAAGEPTGLATAGVVLSIIGLCLAAIGFITCTLCVTCVGGTAGLLELFE